MIELAIALAVGGSLYLLIKPASHPGVVSRTLLMAGRSHPTRLIDHRVSKAVSRMGRASPFEHRRLGEVLTAAGLDPASFDLFKGASLTSAAIGAVVGLAFGPLSIVFAPLMGSLGYRLPVLWLQAKNRSRTAAIGQGLPDALDLLVVCISAGLNISLAIDRVAARTPGPLGEELRRVQRLVGLGVPRREALFEMESRSGSSDVAALVSALVTTDRFGSSVAGSLEALSADLRSKRRRTAEEQARRAPVKMLFPLVFLILPAFILLTIVPLLLGTFRTLGL